MILTISGHDGTFDYEVTLEEGRYHLVKVKTGERYCVHEDHGRWVCDCGDFVWNHEQQGGKCKHLIAILSPKKEKRDDPS